MLQESQLNLNSTETTLLYQIREELRENNRLLQLLTSENNSGNTISPVQNTERENQNTDTKTRRKQA